MKKFAKISAVLAALVLAVAFIGCSSDDDDDDPEVVKVVTQVWGDKKECYDKYTFYDDGTVVNEWSDEEDSDSCKGTYSGDPTKDGSKVIINNGEDEWTIVISGDTFEEK